MQPTVSGPNGEFVSSFLSLCDEAPTRFAPGDRLTTLAFRSPNYEILEALITEKDANPDVSDDELNCLVLRLRIPNEKAPLCLESVGGGGECQVRVHPWEEKPCLGKIVSTTLTYKDVEVVVKGEGDDDTDFLSELSFVYNLEIIESEAFDKLYAKYQNRDAREGVYCGLDDIPVSLRSSLQHSIEAMSRMEEVDYHPGTRNIVRDYVHPSIYPYIKGISKLQGGAQVSEVVEEEIRSDFWGRPNEDSIYQWLPAQFAVDAAGRCSIKTYINNLSKERHPQLYMDLERLFEIALPRFEAVYNYIHSIQFFQGDMEDVEDAPRPPEVSGLTLKNRELQVVTKIVDYELQPGATFEGVWHVEGMSHENIVSTALYIIERSDCIQGGDLLFKRAFLNHECGEVFYGIPQDRHPAAEKIIADGLLPVGKLGTGEGRLIVFPNSHVHKVDTLVNTSSEFGRRRIIVFFLVNPERDIVSTRDVEPQQEVMPRSEALQHRLKLMEERKRHKQDWNVREIELCEH
ncbi:hypothetical protein BSKO_10619 [Bryopsis sp. KO-2023]|nr:hypothetical protein BSKO_10619 [Bryopsis sp. KO-2023]